MLFSPKCPGRAWHWRHFFFQFLCSVAVVKLSRDVTELYEKSTRFYKIICFWIFEVVGFLKWLDLQFFANFPFPFIVTYCL